MRHQSTICFRRRSRIATGSILAVFLFAFLFPFFIQNLSVANAAPNQQINYQGKLTNGSNIAVPDGTYHMRFWLLTSPTAATSTAVWSEDRSTAAGNRIVVRNGLFSVMLGSSTPLSSVNFNQTLYLGVEVGGSAGSPSWDGEMSPRKVLGAVPAAFESDKLDGLDSTQFLRSDAATSLSTTTASTLLSVTQSGTGNILDIFDGSNKVFTILDGGAVGIASATPSANYKLSVGGDAYIAGNITATGTLALLGTGTSTAQNGFNIATGCYAINNVCVGVGSSGVATTSIDSSAKLASIVTDETGTGALVFGTGATLSSTTLSGLTLLQNATSTNFTITGKFFDGAGSAGANGSILQSTASGVQWVATSSLGIQSGASSFLSLTDTPSSYTDRAIIFSGSSQLYSAADFLFASSTKTLTVGGMTLADGLTAHTGVSTTTIPNNQPFAFTIATSTTGTPLFRIDTTPGSESLTLGPGSGDVYIGGVGSPSNLIFEESSTISGQGGNTLTFGVPGDKINFGVNVGIGSSSPYAKLSINANAGDTNTTLFAIGSSTASATTTLFAVLNTGVTTLSNGVDKSVQFLFDNEDNYGEVQIRASDSGGTETLGLNSNNFVFTSNGRNTLTLGENMAENGMVLRGGASFGWSANLNNAGNDGDTIFWRKAAGVLALGTTNTDADGTFVTGNIGIGTTSPRTPLHVYADSDNGSLVGLAAFDTGTQDVTVAGSGSYAGFFANQNTRMYGGVGGYSSGSNYGMGLWGGVASDTLSGAPALFVDDGGNVGIGTAAPIAPLTMQAGVNIICIDPASGQTFQMCGGGGNIGFSGAAVEFYSAPGSQLRAKIDQGGNFGIGTDTPFAKLSVHAYASDTNKTLFAIASSTASATTTLFSITNTGALTMASGNASLTAAGALTVASCVGCGTPGAFGTTSIDTSVELANILGDETGAGKAVFSFGASLATTSLASTTLTASTTFQNATGTTLALTGTFALGSDLISDITGTGLGISGGALNCLTASGSQQGCVSTTDYGTFQSKVSSTSIDTSAELSALLTDETGSAGGGLAVFSINPTLTGATINGNTTLVNATTTTLFSTIASSTNLFAANTLVKDATSTTFFSAIASSTNLFAGNVLVKSATTSSFAAIGTSFFSGNVGVGTTTPNVSKFHVVGSASSLTDGALATFGVNGGGSGDSGLTIGYDTTNNWAWLYARTTGVNARTINLNGTVFVNASGNFGVGTSTPYAKLSVHALASDTNKTLFAIASSTANSTTTLFSVSNTGSTTAANGFNITAGCYAVNGTCLTSGGGSLTGSTGQVAYFSGANTAVGTSSLFIATTQNVGIGTISPSSKLDVYGFINTDANSGYKQGGTTILVASSTWDNLFVGPSAGNTTTSGGGNAIGIGKFALNSLKTGSNLVAVGISALGNATSSISDTAIGTFAMQNFTVNGNSNNTALGAYALRGTLGQSNGTANVAIGYSALTSNTTGADNVGVGVNALISNTSGSNNLAAGFQALYANTTGNDNVALGNGTLVNSVSGSQNVAAGRSALLDATSTSANVALGQEAMRHVVGSQNGSNNYNIGIGYNAMLGDPSGATGFQNTVVGTWGLYYLTSGHDNVAIGHGALDYATSSSGETAVGSNAMVNFTSPSGSNNTAVGTYALAGQLGQSYGYYNTALGGSALYSNTSGYENTAVGLAALLNNSTGYSNTASGYEALYHNTSGYENVALGMQAMFNNATGTWNTAIGPYALYGSANASGTSNVAIGYCALCSNAGGDQNIGIGDSALSSNTYGFRNIAIGESALTSVVNADAFENTAIGVSSSDSLISGAGNISIGRTSLHLATSTGSNISIGEYSMYSFTGTQSGSADLNTVVGSFSMSGQTGSTGYQNSVFGANAFSSVQTAVGNTIIGRSSANNMLYGYYNSTLGLYSLHNATSTSNNVAIGASSQENMTGTQGNHDDWNVAVGSNALRGVSGATGQLNTALGSYALYSISSGSHNVAVGESAGYYFDTGSWNSILGPAAGLSLTTGSYNTLIGVGYNGALVDVPNANTDNFLNIGNLIYGNLASGGGYVGIGTQSPSALLEVSGGSYNTSLMASSDDDIGPGLDLINTGAGGNDYAWVSTGSGSDAGAGSLIVYHADNGTLPFVILNNDFVGIGSTTPSAQLTIQGTVGQSTIFNVASSTGTTVLSVDASGALNAKLKQISADYTVASTSASISVGDLVSYIASGQVVRTGAASGLGVGGGGSYRLSSDIVSSNVQYAAALDSTHFVVGYTDQTSNFLHAVVCSVSGSAISCGSASTTVPVSANNISVAALDSTHFVTTYRDSTNSSSARARVCTISGTSISSCGTPVSFANNTFFGSSNQYVAALDSTHFVAVYQDNGSFLYGVAASVAGNTITAGTPVSLYPTQNVGTMSVVALDSSHFAVTFNHSFSSFALVNAVSGTTITAGNLSQPSSVWGSAATALSKIDSTHFIAGFGGEAIVASYSGTSTLAFGDGYVPDDSITISFDGLTMLDSTHFVAGDATGVIAGVISSSTVITYGSYQSSIASTTGSINALVALDSTHFVYPYAGTQDFTNYYMYAAVGATTVAKPLGMATNAASAGGTVTVASNGIVSGLSGLTAGSTYYWSPVSGLTLESSSYQVGVAISSTAILLNTSDGARTDQFFGDAVFANGFRITEAPGSPQGLLFKNQLGQQILGIDETGKLTVAGGIAAQNLLLNSITYATSTANVCIGENGKLVASVLGCGDASATTTIRELLGEGTTTDLGLLTGDASSTATSTPWLGIFAGASQGFKDALHALALDVVRISKGGFYATVGLFDKVFAREVHVEDKLCINDTCVTESELKALLDAQHIAPAPNGDTGTSTGETASTTSPSDPDETPDDVPPPDAEASTTDTDGSDGTATNTDAVGDEGTVDESTGGDNDITDPSATDSVPSAPDPDGSSTDSVSDPSGTGSDQTGGDSIAEPEPETPQTSEPSASDSASDIVQAPAL